MVSDLGKVLDPFADKLTQGTIMICLISRYPFILWLVILFAVKELIMFLMGYLTMKYAHSVNSAKWYGKACTVITLAAVITLILFPQLDIFWVKCIVGIDAAAIVLSLLLYIRFYRQVWQSKHAQMPIKISPELATRIKTGSVLTLLIAACFFPPAGIPKFAYLTLYLLSASLIGQIGDLLMSGVKRVIGIKDFSRLLPGHGGILDRFDSLLLVAPYTLIYASVILP